MKNTTEIIQNNTTSQKVIRRGDVWYVGSLDTVGHELEGNRPAVIVSDNTINQHSSVVLAVLLTTGNPKKFAIDTHPDVYSTGKLSVAVCEQILRIDTDRLTSFVCSLTLEEMQKIDASLMTSLHLQNSSKDLLELKVKCNIYQQIIDKYVDKGKELSYE